MKEKDKVRLQKIGANLLRIRTAKGLTQEELSYRCDVDRAKISKIESGQVNLVVTTLLDLAEGLEVDPSELLDLSSKLKGKK
jgi:Predicted transcriptional regulator with C-terminal CBS domains